MNIIAFIKQKYLISNLKRALFKPDKPKFEIYLKKLENEIVKTYGITNEKAKIKIYDSLGLTCVMSKRFSEAESIFLEEIALLGKCEENVNLDLFYTHYNLSEAYYAHGLFKEAVVHYLQALSLSEKVTLPSEIEIHQLLRGLVNSYAFQDLYLEAEPFAMQELKLREKMGCVLYDCLIDLGYINFNLKRYKDAEFFLVKALLLIEEKFPNANKKVRENMNLWIEDILEHLVDIYTLLLQYDKAQAAFQKLKEFNPNSKFELPFFKINSPEVLVRDSNIDQKILPIKNIEAMISRNDLCPCGSGKKFKKCHGR